MPIFKSIVSSLFFPFSILRTTIILRFLELISKNTPCLTLSWNISASLSWNLPLEAISVMFCNVILAWYLYLLALGGKSLRCMAFRKHFEFIHHAGLLSLDIWKKKMKREEVPQIRELRLQTGVLLVMLFLLDCFWNLDILKNIKCKSSKLD